MSYSYPVQPSYTKFFNSTTLAIIASFGLHILVLGVALPNWSTNSQPKYDGMNNVKVIELTEAEKSRLPNLESQIPDFSQFPDTSLSNTPLYDSPDLTASLPPLSNSYPSASLPALPQLPTNVYSPPVASLPPTPPISYLPTPQNLTLPNNIPQAIPDNPGLNSNPSPNFPPPSDSLSRDDILNAPLNAGDQRRAEIERQLRENGNIPQNASLPRITNPNVPSNSVPPTVQDDRQRRLLGDVLNEAENIQAGLTRDPSNSSLAEATKNDAQWMAENQIALSKNSNQITIAGSYPRIACSKQLSGSSVYGVMVDTQGKVAGTPTLLRSSEYGVLNQQAIRDITSRSFENSTGSLKPYRVTVTFNPSGTTCPSSTLAQPQEQERETTTTRVTPPEVPVTVPSPTRSVTPPNVPANQKPQPLVQPQPNQPRTPVVEQSPLPLNNQPVTPVVEQSPPPVNNQPVTPVVEQSPLPLNNQPNNNNLNTDNLPTSNKPATPAIQPPSNPATRKPEPETVTPPSPTTSQKPGNSPQPIATPATKKPPTTPAETENNVSNVPNNTIIAEP